MATGDIIGILIVLAMIAMSWRADRRLRHVERLPMQWDWNGEVNWTASRRFALAFAPVLTTAILLLFALIREGLVPADKGDPGQAIQIITAVTLLAVHAYHLRRASREVLKTDR